MNGFTGVVVEVNVDVDVPPPPGTAPPENIPPPVTGNIPEPTVGKGVWGAVEKGGGEVLLKGLSVSSFIHGRRVPGPKVVSP